MLIRQEKPQGTLNVKKCLRRLVFPVSSIVDGGSLRKDKLNRGSFRLPEMGNQVGEGGMSGESRFLWCQSWDDGTVSSSEISDPISKSKRGRDQQNHSSA